MDGRVDVSRKETRNGHNGHSRNYIQPPSPKRIQLLKQQLQQQELNQVNVSSCRNGTQIPEPSGLCYTNSLRKISLASLNEEDEHQVREDFCQETFPDPARLPNHTSSVTSQRVDRTQLPISKSNGAMSSNSESEVSPKVSKVTSSPPPPTRHQPQNWKSRLLVIFMSLRPQTFTQTLTSVTLGAALAFKATGNIDLVIFLISCFTVLAVHGGGNLVNTFYDYVNGIDKERSKCEDRTLVDHRLTIDEVKHLGIIAYAFGCFGFICLVFLSPAWIGHLAMVYVCGILSSFFYTGGIGLKYIGLGDIIIMVMFGPISILFSFICQAGYIELTTIWFAVPLALHTEAILHSNNTRDMDNDRGAGAVTLAILIGPTFCRIIYALLLFIPYLMLLTMALIFSSVFLLPLVTIFKAFDLERQFRSGHLINIPKSTASLNFWFNLCYIVSCFLVPPSHLPWIQVTAS